jgi:hypothetical protein
MILVGIIHGDISVTLRNLIVFDDMVHFQPITIVVHVIVVRTTYSCSSASSAHLFYTFESGNIAYVLHKFLIAPGVIATMEFIEVNYHWLISIRVKGGEQHRIDAALVVLIFAGLNHGRVLIMSSSFSANGILAAVTKKPKIPRYLNPAMFTEANAKHAKTITIALLMGQIT